MKSSHRSLAPSIELDPTAAETKRSRLAAAGSLALRSKLPILSVAVMGITGLMLVGTASAVPTAPPPVDLGASANAATVPPPVDLGASANAAVAANAGVSNQGVSTVNGDVSSPAALTGLAGCPGPANCVAFSNGAAHQNDTTSTNEVAAANAAFTAITTTNVGGGTSIGPQLVGPIPILPGLYDVNPGTTLITGTLLLDASGGPSSVWIFRAKSDITAATSSDFQFVGADAATAAALECNVFWTAVSKVTLNGTRFVGTVLAGTEVAVGDNVDVHGRLFAGTQVTLIHDTITQPTCATPPGSGGGSGGTPGGGSGGTTGGGSGGTTGGGSVATGGGPGGTGGGSAITTAFAGPATPVASLPKLTG